MAKKKRAVRTIHHISVIDKNGHVDEREVLVYHGDEIWWHPPDSGFRVEIDFGPFSTPLNEHRPSTVLSGRTLKKRVTARPSATTRFRYGTPRGRTRRTGPEIIVDPGGFVAKGRTQGKKGKKKPMKKR